MEKIITQRLLLRPFMKTDLEAMHAYCINPNVGSAAGWKPHETIDDSKRVLQAFMEGDEVWAIVEQASGALIGSCGLHHDHKRMHDGVRMLGYVLDEAYWGRGYMTECAKALISYGFLSMGLDLISVYHFSVNNRSRRVIEKCGFRYEGTLMQARKLYDGRVIDDVCYSITREEFLRRQQVSQ
ncbi:MAG: GNAT family N-acetyltransferase [Ruminococcaceae bacterium]|nr:GNAT family N-acetyltransferase [Oscillospiraceae bacterium]